MLKMQDMPEEMLDEFDREVDLMNKLRHKNIGKMNHCAVPFIFQTDSFDQFNSSEHRKSLGALRLLRSSFKMAMFLR
jgi:hypothetical protein